MSNRKYVATIYGDCSHYAHGHQLTSAGTIFLVKKLFDAAKTIGPLAQVLSLLG